MAFGFRFCHPLEYALGIKMSTAHVFITHFYRTSEHIFTFVFTRFSDLFKSIRLTITSQFILFHRFMMAHCHVIRFIAHIAVSQNDNMDSINFFPNKHFFFFQRNIFSPNSWVLNTKRHVFLWLFSMSFSGFYNTKFKRTFVSFANLTKKI